MYGGSNISSLASTRTVALVSLVCVFASIFVMDDIKLIMMLGRQVIVVVSSIQLVAETILVRSFQIVRTVA